MSSLDPQIRDQAYQFFAQEAIEFLHTIEGGLMQLRSDRSVPQVHSLMRAAHSIKGGAASVDLPGIQKIAHRLEDVFRALYRQEKEIDLDVEELLLQAFDCLRVPLVEQIETGYYNAEEAIAKAEPIFSVLENYLGDSIGADLELPTAAELGFDIAQVVFSGDVTMGIERLKSVLAHPEVEEVEGEIRAQAEVFAGIAELLNLPGFKAIAQTTVQALDRHPENPLLVGQTAIANFTEAQAAVLAGDRSQGGTPSTELLALAGATDSSNGSSQPAVADLTDVDSSILPDLGLDFSDADLNPLADLSDLSDLSNLSLDNLDITDNVEDISNNFSSAFSDDLQGDLADLDLSALNATVFDDARDSQIGDRLAPSTESQLVNTDLAHNLGDLDADTYQLIDRGIGLNEEDLNAELGTGLDALCDRIDEVTLDEAPTTQFQFSSFADEADLNENVTLLDNTFGNISEAEADSLIAAEISAFPSLPDIPITSVSAPSTTTPTNANASDTSGVKPQLTPPPPDPARRPAARLEITTNSGATSSQSPAQLATSMVRVDLGRMERLNNLVGELVTQENGSMLQSQQLQETLRTLQRRFERFEQIAKELEKCLDTSQTSQVSSIKSEALERNSLSLSTVLTPTNALAELDSFDPLLMDSYSYVYTVVQESLEEIAQMGETMRDMALLTQQSQQTQRQKQQTLKQVRNDLLWARMMPLSEILQRFPRMVRDLAAKNNKQVKLKTVGANTLVDKAVLEKLFDPLVHLIRNAFDHGTETPEERKTKGKPPEATIELRAYHRGNQTYIEVRDDGRGIDIEKVRSVAIAREAMTKDEAMAASAAELYELLFSPSFSTADKVSEISGRGMGLPAVREQIGSLKGGIVITSELGQGTTFTIRLPLTLTIAKLLIFSISSNLMAIPVDTLTSIVTAADADIQTIQGKQFYRYQERLISLYPHSAFSYAYPLPKRAEEPISTMALPSEEGIPLLIVSSGEQTIALEVDQILSEQELVIKPFGKAIAAPSYLYGCTIQGDGSMLPVIDGLALVSKLLNPQPLQDKRFARSASTFADLSAAPNPQQNARSVLVIDDSLTTRQTLALTLKKAGYRVIQAGDGRDGLDKLQQEPEIDAVFCDVEMPRMNGFEFLSQCRQEPARAGLPIIMLTSRSGEKHRSLAKLLKATAYLTKPYLEQELLKTLNSCLESQPVGSIR
ncbi:hybrid sensor histidine kinase/response regulator [Pseudanabaena sp. PCC 6802]|uniref:hybrid sensor histidine kinase/response regulator n=1 Tax=Pseudanabaena sp. PCC 6802 TaxID=118173 RepID=UPI000346DC0F|nr:hybrid sensor histidine kinase/response regulator [Pseudanabaena sp. PCC 6802]